MDLQKKLIQLAEYKCSFKYVDSYFLISVTYPEKWSIIPSEDSSIEVAEEDGVTFYAAPIETEIGKAFDLIDITISYNLDIEKKMALLKYNIGKLQELFAEKDLDELETIEFTFKEKGTTRRKTKTKTSINTKQKKLESMDKVILQPLIQSEPLTLDEGEITSTSNGNDDITWIDVRDKEAVQSEENVLLQNKYLEEVER